MNPQSPILDRLNIYLRDTIAPQAAILDRDADRLADAMQGLGDRDLLALRLPKQWGGTDLDESTFRTIQIEITRYSGALSFLQIQHQSAGSLLLKSENDALKQEYLPHLASGARRVGIGFSQLRRPGDPIMKAVPVEGGYELNGTVPWVTGYGSFDDFIIGATLPDGRALYGIVPFRNCQRDGGEIAFGEPMELAVMNSTQTAVAEVRQWRLSHDRVLFVQPADAVRQRDRANVLHHSFFSLGCAQAALDILAIAAEKKPLPFIGDTWHALERQLSQTRDTIFAEQVHPTRTFARRVQLRANAITLAVRCAHAAVTASSGAANSLHHPAQRVYREAMLFSVSGQTTAVMEATLGQISS